jgi:tRNA(Ile)-lysidine synthase
MNLYNRFDFFLKDTLNLETPHNILLAVSGGIDSMVLLDLFRKTNHRISVAHCNFGLRENESDADHQLVKGFCNTHAIRFFEKNMDVTTYSNVHKLGIQEAARDMRYEWFNKLITDNGIDLIATAHHLNDVAETVLFNMARGTGISGLHGIPARNGNRIRPLLFATRKDIAAYASQHHTPYREDRSNLSDKYSRNKIRNHVIPVLQEINPLLEIHIQSLTERVSFIETIYRAHIDNAWKNCHRSSNDRIEIDIHLLQQLTPLKQYLFEFLYPYGYNASQVAEIIAALKDQSGKSFYSPSAVLIKDRDTLIISKLPRSTKEVFRIDTDIPFITTDTISIGFEYMPGTNTLDLYSGDLYIDCDKLSFPLTLRKWNEGDRFTPLGMTHSKKISDFFIDEKIDLLNKQNAWLLCSSLGEIICIVPYRIDDRFKVTHSSTTVLKITFTQHG